MTRHLLASTAAALLLTINFAIAQEGLDTDGDGQVGEQEFMENATFGDTFDEYDADGDGLLTEDEYASSIYDTYDTDGDGVWDEDEVAAFQEDDWF